MIGLLQAQKEAFREKLDNDSLSTVVLVLAADDEVMCQLVARYVAAEDRNDQAWLIFKMGERWMWLTQTPEELRYEPPAITWEKKVKKDG